MTDAERRSVLEVTPEGIHQASTLCAYWSLLLNRVVTRDETIEALGGERIILQRDPRDEDGQ
jgi:hypothetical protein